MRPMDISNNSVNFLVIEDSCKNQIQFKRKVGSSINSSNIEYCKTIEDSRGVLKNSKIDLIIVNLELSGSRIIDGVRKIIEIHSDLPLIVLADEKENAENISEIMNSGAEDFLSNKVDRATLLRAMRYAIIRKQSQVSLIESIKEAESLAKKQEELIAIVSHDLKSPLVNIQGLVELLSTQEMIESMEEQDGVLKRIQQNSIFGLTMIKELLDRASTEGEIELHTSKLDISGLIQEIVWNYANQFINKGIELSFHSIEKKYVNGDSFRINQVINNLLDNALKYLSRGNKVSIHTKIIKKKRKDDLADLVQISIRDNGPGIEASKLETLFSMYQQVKESDRKVGYGLGLAICKNICLKHKGNIWVESQLGHGCAFHFTIPHIEDQSANIKNNSAINSVLIVDDDPDMRFFIKTKLSIEFSNIESSENGAKALEKLRNKDFLPDFIILDLEMPVLNGEEFLEIVSNDKELSLIPIIVHSSRTDKFHTFKKYPQVIKCVAKGGDLMGLADIVQEYHIVSTKQQI